MFVRILTVLATAPVFNIRSIPVMTKIGFAALLTFTLLPLTGRLMQTSPMVLPGNLGLFMLLVAHEILFGVTLGFISNLIFMALSMAAGLMGLQTGFNAASLFSPFTNISSTALEQFYTLLALALFLAINGHHMLIQALVRTFEIAPLGSFVMNAVTIEYLINFSAEIFVIAIRLALPVIGTLLLTDVGLGLIARAVPQIQVFFVGLPLKVGLGFVTLAITLTLTFPVIKTMFSQMIDNILLISGQ
jgi:flagellar biosynthetic protein FliR